MSFLIQAYFVRVYLLPGLIAVTGIMFCADGEGQDASQTMVQSSGQVSSNYGKLPMSFESNQGQSESDVRFLSHGRGYSLLLTDSAAVLSLSKAPREPAKNGGNGSRSNSSKYRESDTIRMELTGASLPSQAVGVEQLKGTVNYFIGNDPSRWHSNIPTYGQVRYPSVYRGVDLIYYGNQQQLEYDFVVRENADPEAIKLRFAGAMTLSLDGDGSLQIAATNGSVVFRKPIVYQDFDGHRTQISGCFKLLDRNSVGFSVGRYDHSQPLVIDPVLAYSTYLGGSNDERPQAIALGEDGSAYVTGFTGSTDFPTTAGAYQVVNKSTGLGTAFITKLNPSGTALIYSTYLGGSGADGGDAIALDSSGNAYVTGFTSSPDFPVTTSAFQSVNKTGPKKGTAFVTKLNAAGSALLYSTYLGGSNQEQAYGIAVDGSGEAYVAGTTQSTDFPVTAGAYQPKSKITYKYGETGFVSKLNAQGTKLVYSTYLGGSTFDYLDALAVDRGGNAYVTGFTESKDYPVTPGAFQPVDKQSGDLSATGFITKLNSTGASLVYSTYLGGTYSDAAYAIAVDGAGDAYVAGQTSSTDFPVTPNAFQTRIGSEQPAGFVSRMNPAGSGLIYSTYLSGSTYEQVNGIAVNDAGNAFIVGVTLSSNFPVTAEAFQTTSKGGSSGTGFVTALKSDGTGLLYSTYLGGTSNGEFNDQAFAVAIDGSGGVYVTGSTDATDFPVTSGTFQDKDLNVTLTGFVTKLNLGVVSSTQLTANVNPQLLGQAVTVTATVLSAFSDEVPTGTVAFLVDGKSVSSATLSSSGTATFSTSTLTAGKHTIQADYGGSAGFVGSAATLTETIVLPVAATPTFTPTAGTYQVAQSVALADTTPGATIYYTTDGTAPTTGSIKYSAAINVSSTTTIEAIAVATGYTSSAVVAATYTILTPQVAISPSSLTFNTTVIGTSTSPQLVTLTNTGTAALTAKSYAFTGTNAGAFEITAKSCGTSLAINASCTISIAFKPTAAGTLTASLAATDNAPGSPQLVALTGTGALPPTIAISPRSLSFPSTTIGSASASQVITVKNISTAAVAVKSYLFAGADASAFALTAKTCTTSLPAGASCTLSVDFKPTVAGTLEASLVATDSSSDSPQTIALTGAGATQPTVSLSPASLTFAATKVGTTSAAQIVTLTNTGSNSMTASSFTFTGSNPTSFVLSAKSCGTTLAAGANCTLSVAFKPTAAVALTGKLAAADNAVGSPQTVTLSGSGN